MNYFLISMNTHTHKHLHSCDNNNNNNNNKIVCDAGSHKKKNQWTITAQSGVMPRNLIYCYCLSLCYNFCFLLMCLLPVRLCTVRVKNKQTHASLPPNWLNDLPYSRQNFILPVTAIGTLKFTRAGSHLVTRVKSINVEQRTTVKAFNFIAGQTDQILLYIGGGKYT